jgi:hypothetical protein
VGGTIYAVPAEADAVPHEAPRARGLIKMSHATPGAGQYCQCRDVAVIDTLRFSFRLSRDDAAERGGHVAATITRTDAVSPAWQPALPPIAPAAIAQISPLPLAIDRADRTARFDLRLRLRDGSARSMPVRCFWASGSPGAEASAMGNCRIIAALAVGSALEVIVSPPSNDRDYVGRQLIHAMRDSESFD